ncbi:hypothetical protein J1N35_025598, partial [Gossypium stocksii]
MSRKRTRSSKATLENSILIDKEVKERFDSIFKHQPMMLEKGFNLKSNDVMLVRVPIRKIINALKCSRILCEFDYTRCYGGYRLKEKAEGTTNPEFRVELEEEPIKLSVEPKVTTPMPTSA